jgi:hypothetical protein
MSYSRETWVDNTGPPFLGAVKLNTWEAAHADASTFMISSGGRVASAEVNITFASGVIATILPLASGGQHVLGASALMTSALAAAVPGLIYVASGTVAQPTVNAPLYRSDGAAFRKIAPGIIPVVANLPTNPNDGDEIYYLADAANSVMWHLRYRAASVSANKWDFLGGSPLSSVTPAATAVTTAGAGFGQTAFATTGFNLPLTGLYWIEWGGTYNPTNTNVYYLMARVAAANVMATSILAAGMQITGGSGWGVFSFRYLFAGAVAGNAVDLTHACNVASQGLTCYERRVSAIPVRVG